MMVCDRTWWKFVSYNPDFPEKLQLIVRHVVRNNEYIDTLAKSIAKFMDEVRADYEYAMNYREVN